MALQQPETRRRSFDVAGIYIDPQNGGSIASGGNLIDQVTLLQWQSGLLMRAAQRDTFSYLIPDTNRDYSWEISDNSYGLIGTGQIGATFTGPNVLGSGGYAAQGIGMWISANGTSMRTNGIETLTGNVVGVIDDARAIHNADDIIPFWCDAVCCSGRQYDLSWTIWP